MPKIKHCLSTFSILVVLASVGLTHDASARRRAPLPMALVFGGAGTENDLPGGTLNAAISAARSAGYQTYVVTDLVPEDVLKNADVWIQPGGPNFEQAEDMQKTGVFEQVKKFVADGGGYVGFCGGGYMAQSTGSLGLGLLPGNAIHQDEPTSKLEVLWNGRKRFMHFEFGPKFEVRPGIEVFATYASNGAPAAIRGGFGKGHVTLSGPHPEAWKSWEPVGDPDGSDVDLAMQMIRWAGRGHWNGSY